jgi:hypothetical protein
MIFPKGESWKNKEGVDLLPTAMNYREATMFAIITVMA